MPDDANTLSTSLGNGITLTNAGSYQSPFTIAAGGYIFAPHNAAVYSDLSQPTLYNEGSIAGSTYGVSFAAGGYVSNSAGVTLFGGVKAIVIESEAGTVVNQGKIEDRPPTGLPNRYDAIYLGAGGTVTNDGTGSNITGYEDGIFAANAAASVLNQGAITGTAGDGVVLQGGGAVTNSGTAASIYGEGSGVAISAAPATLINQGNISSHAGDAVYVQGGTITNDAGAAIASYHNDGIYSNGSATTLINDGTILSTAGALGDRDDGVLLQNNGYVTNAAGARIAGVAGLAITGYGTVQNAGTIVAASTIGYDAFTEIGLNLGSGTVTNSAGGAIDGNYQGIDLAGNGSIYNAGAINGGAKAVDFHGQDTLTNVAGGSVNGQVYSSDTLTLFNAGAINGQILVHSGSAYISNASSGIITAGIHDQAASPATIINDGAIESGGIDLVGGGTVTDAGSITYPYETAVYLGGTGTNELIVEAGATFVGAVDGGTSATNILSLSSGTGSIDNFSGFQTIDFGAGATWSLSGDQAVLAAGETINGFVTGDELTLTGFAATSYSFVAGTGLELVSASSTVTVDLTGNPALLVTSDGSNSYILENTSQLSTGDNNGITLTTSGNSQSPYTITTGGDINTADSIGVYSTLASATLFNEGRVTAAGYAVLFTGGGYVSNSYGASILGTSVGVAILSTSATLLNAGTIGARDAATMATDIGDAVYVLGGTITNDARATIVSRNGTALESGPSAAVTLTNDGVIISQQAGPQIDAGVSLLGNGYVTNAASATITGIIGLQIEGYGSVQNAGTLIGVSTNGTYGSQFGLILTNGVASNSSTGDINAGYRGIEIDSGSIGNAGSIYGYNAGIVFQQAGTIDNTGTVHGSYTAIKISGTAASTILNAGMITARTQGIVEQGPGSIYNSVTGTIEVENFTAIKLQHGGSIDNAGSIGGGQNADGISLQSGGTVVNAATGEITTGSNGDGIFGFGGTVFNEGMIDAGIAGIDLLGGYLSNSATGTIIGTDVGAQGAFVAATFVNAGTIEGGSYAIGFQGNGNLLVVDPGAVFIGTVGGVSLDNTLELASGASAGTIADIGVSFVGFQTIDFASGATWSASGDQAGLASGQTIEGFAPGDELTITDFAATSASYVSGLGLELVSAGTTITVALAGGSGAQVTSNGTVSYITDQATANPTYNLTSVISYGITLSPFDTRQSPFTIDSAGTIDTTGTFGVYSYPQATLVNEGGVTAAVYGVTFANGGYLANNAGATIFGGEAGIDVHYGYGTVVNQGSIGGGTTSNIRYLNDGVYLGVGGTVTNEGTAAAISGHYAGVLAKNDSAYVQNQGTISGHYGVDLQQGGAVTNSGTAASIYGSQAGVAIMSADATVTNQGTIASDNGDAVYTQGGTIINDAGGTIVSQKYDGVVLQASGTVENAGTIETMYYLGYGIVLHDGGTIVNDASGYISGDGQANDIRGYPGAYDSINNYGTIANAANGVVIYSSYITNQASATIAGSYSGVFFVNGTSTIANAGTIYGTSVAGIQANPNATVTVDNSASGTIASSQGDGIQLLGAGSIQNAGLIEGLDYGISAASAVSIYNSVGGSIESANDPGIDLQQGGSVYNAGTVSSDGADGIYLKNGGTVVNAATGLITSHQNATDVYGKGATIFNDGTITDAQFGVGLYGGYVSNSAGGTIGGGIYGVLVAPFGPPVTIVNAGSIAGPSYAVKLDDGGNTLIVDPGAVFDGAVGGSYADNLLALASGSTAGTLDTDSFSGFSTIEIESGADWTLTGTDGDLASDFSTSEATVSLAANSVLSLTGTIDPDQTIVFAGNDATLGVALGAEIAGTIALEAARQTIDIASLALGSVTASSFDSATDVLSLDYQGESMPELLTFASGAAADYRLADDGAGGTDIVIPCFVTDTRILTTKGYFPVQNLCVGDRVVTVRAGGPASAEIVWLGQRTVDCESVEAPEAAWPILFRAGALGPAMPVRDLWVSPEHCLMLDGVLIAAKLLVNGQSIRQVARPRVTYWHVELTAHDVLLAEGVPAESYLDTGNRAAFSEGDAPAGRRYVHHWTDTCLPMAFGREALGHLDAHLARHAAPESLGAF